MFYTWTKLRPDAHGAVPTDHEDCNTPRTSVLELALSSLDRCGFHLLTTEVRHKPEGVFTDSADHKLFRRVRQVAVPTVGKGLRMGSNHRDLLV